MTIIHLVTDSLLLKNHKDHNYYYRISNLSQLNSFHIFKAYIYKDNFNIILHPFLTFPK